MQEISNYITKNFEVIIIGAGGTGLTAALSALDNGLKKVAVISKVFPTLSHTGAAKGGINAALGNKVKDNWQCHSLISCANNNKELDFNFKTKIVRV